MKDAHTFLASDRTPTDLIIARRMIQPPHVLQLNQLKIAGEAWLKRELKNQADGKPRKYRAELAADGTLYNLFLEQLQSSLSVDVWQHLPEVTVSTNCLIFRLFSRSGATAHFLIGRRHGRMPHPLLLCYRYPGARDYVANLGECRFDVSSLRFYRRAGGTRDALDEKEVLAKLEFLLQELENDTYSTERQHTFHLKKQLQQAMASKVVTLADLSAWMAVRTSTSTAKQKEQMATVLRELDTMERGETADGEDISAGMAPPGDEDEDVRPPRKKQRTNQRRLQKQKAKAKAKAKSKQPREKTSRCGGAWRAFVSTTVRAGERGRFSRELAAEFRAIKADSPAEYQRLRELGAVMTLERQLGGKKKKKRRVKGGREERAARLNLWRRAEAAQGVIIPAAEAPAQNLALLHDIADKTLAWRQQRRRD